ncbi:WD40 repeat domain-containing protein [Nostoc sp. FACHB-280]|uniref:WD40 repeat domain-containing protein n=1 Tax=Nostoc sp. FACHB-280 TaxID=2692839 RepID=UPI0019C052B6|nr:WD40 repeat domain-containing protein [Nostoc sp. FACHB-280]MBD2494766.1 WD40 repeat domain-containing protein [Nostoc sp. FACHB-280]
MTEYIPKFFKYQSTFYLNSSFTSKTLSYDGKILVTYQSEDFTIQVWDMQSGQLINSWLTESSKAINLTKSLNAVAITPNGKTLLTGGNILKAWDLATGKQIRIFRSSGWIFYINISTDSQILLTQGSAGTIIWNLQSGKKIRRYLGTYTVMWVISPNSKTVVGEDGFDDKIKVWDLITGKELLILDNHGAIAVRKLSFSQDGKLVAGSGYDGIKIWDFETGEQIQRVDKFKNVPFHEHLDHVGNLIFNFNNQTLFSSGSDGLIQIWDIGNGKNVGKIKGENDIIDIAMSNDSQILVGFGRNAQNQQTIEVWKTD